MKKLDHKDLYIASLKAEIKGLRQTIWFMRVKYVDLHNKYRHKKIDYNNGGHFKPLEFGPLE